MHGKKCLHGEGNEERESEGMKGDQTRYFLGQCDFEIYISFDFYATLTVCRAMRWKNWNIASKL